MTAPARDGGDQWQQRMAEAVHAAGVPMTATTALSIAAALLPVLDAARRDAAAQALEDAADEVARVDALTGRPGHVAAALRDRAAALRTDTEETP